MINLTNKQLLLIESAYSLSLPHIRSFDSGIGILVFHNNEIIVLKIKDFYNISVYRINKPYETNRAIIAESGNIFYTSSNCLYSARTDTLRPIAPIVDFHINKVTNEILLQQNNQFFLTDINLNESTLLKIKPLDRYNISAFYDNYIISISDKSDKAIIIQKTDVNNFKKINYTNIKTGFNSLNQFLVIFDTSHQIDPYIHDYKEKNNLYIIDLVDNGQQMKVIDKFIRFIDDDYVLLHQENDKFIILDTCSFSKEKVNINFQIDFSIGLTIDDVDSKNYDLFFFKGNLYFLYIRFQSLYLVDIYNNLSTFIEDEDLRDYQLLCFNQSQGAYWLKNSINKTILAVDITTGKIVCAYNLPTLKKIQFIKNGTKLIWLSDTGALNQSDYPYNEMVQKNSKKEWRDIGRDMSDVPSEELWLEMIDILMRLTFSDQTSGNQLNPWDFSLKIPSISFLNNYDQKRTINSLLAIQNDPIITDKEINKNIETIYHELFHVLQANATYSVFEYFSSISKFQQSRKTILKLIAPILNFLDNDFYEKNVSIFHYLKAVENERFIKFHEPLLSYYLKRLYPYFNTANDIDLHTFQLIEGSAKIFGLCCSGKDVIKEIDNELKNKTNEEINDKNSKFALYQKAYYEFRENNGSIPLIFILICFACLDYGIVDSSSKNTPPNLFRKCLNEVKHWEEMLKDEYGKDINNFRKTTTEIYRKICYFLQGTANYDECNTHENLQNFDKNDEGSVFEKTLLHIRKKYPNKDAISSILELILNPEYVLDVHKYFLKSINENSNILREYKCLRDFEKLLSQSADFDPDDQFPSLDIYCCQEHGDVGVADSWYDCINKDSFVYILEHTFGIDIPERFKFE